MTQKTKQLIYIFTFTILGLLLGFLMHMWIELWYIKKLLADFDKYSLGYTWADLFYAHQVMVPALLLLFGAFGFWSGKYWWQQIYVLKRYPKKWAKYIENNR